MSNWPLQKDCNDFYGDPRNSDDVTVASPEWESANLIYITPPYQMYYDGKPVKRIRVHKKCADAFMAAFNAIWVAADKDQKVVDQWGASVFGGSYNFRLMRTSNNLSMHSWGCAIDLDPERNGLGNQSPRFLQYPQVVKAFTDQGAIWGGTWHGGGCDGMHFQFARIS